MRIFFYFLFFISVSSYANLYIDDNYDIILEEDNHIVNKYDVFDDIKLKLKKGDVVSDSIYIDIERKGDKYIISTDIFSSRYYEYFDIIDNGYNNFIINKITTVSVDKSDFYSKTITCTSNVKIPLIDFKHGEYKNNSANCVTTYPLENTLIDFENYISSIYKDKYYINEISKDRIDSYLSRYPLNKATVNYYNNIAFYLVEGRCPEPAIYLLEDIVNKFKDREVAYINLGDSYLLLNQKEKAINMYSIYISKMESKGKKKIIPSRIYRALNR